MSAAIKKDSAWIDLAKIILTVGIVLMHASLPDRFDQGYKTFDIVGKGIIDITAICVPLFFVLSGYLFFRGVERKPKAVWFGNKLKRRFTSLLIPYLIANCVAWCIFAAATKWAPSMLSGFLGDNWKDPLFVLWKGPVNLSLWFIRELIVVCLLTPLIWLLVRYTWGIAVIVLGVLWGLGIGPAPLFFFSLGAAAPILQLHSTRLDQWQQKHPLRIDPSWRAWCLFIYLYHYLLLIATKKFLLHLLQEENSTTLLAIWFGSAIFTLLFLTLVYFTMRRLIPRLFSILVGGK